MPWPCWGTSVALWEELYLPLCFSSSENAGASTFYCNPKPVPVQGSSTQLCGSPGSWACLTWATGHSPAGLPVNLNPTPHTPHPSLSTTMCSLQKRVCGLCTLGVQRGLKGSVVCGTLCCLLLTERRGGRQSTGGRKGRTIISRNIRTNCNLWKNRIGVSMQWSRGDLVLLVDVFMALHKQMRSW